MCIETIKIILALSISAIAFNAEADVKLVKVNNNFQVTLDIPSAYQENVQFNPGAKDELRINNNIYFSAKNPELDTHLIVYAYPKATTSVDENTFTEERFMLAKESMSLDGFEASEIKKMKINGIPSFQFEYSGIYKSFKEKNSTLKTYLLMTIYSFPEMYVVLRERSGVKPETYSAAKPGFIAIANSLSSKDTPNNLNAISTTGMDDAKRKCLELGFKDKTEAFGKCVLRLSK